MWKQTLPDLRDFKLHTFKITQFSKVETINIFKKRVEFFRAVVKAQWDEGGGRLLLGDNTGGGAVMLRPVGFQRVGFWI
jgi:hypothetical protein